MMLCIVGAVSLNAQITSGSKYYLQNVSTGEYWGAGDDTGWGTRAMLVEHPQYVTLVSNDDGTYKMESQVSNGGTNYYFNGNYMDGAAVSLTFTSSGDNFTIANGDTYYGSGGSTSAIQDNTVDASSSAALWKLYTEAEMRATLDAASADNPIDATFLFLDPGFGRNNRNYNAWTIGTNTNLNIGRQGTDNKNNYGCGESYHSNFSLIQSATVPNGTYKIEARAFYRQDGSDNEHLPVISANDENVTFPLKTGSENSMQDAQNSFQAGSYAVDPIYVSVTDGSLTLSLKLENNTNLWCIWDGFDITYYGDVTVAEVLLADYVNAYKEALATAQSYQSQDMFDEDKTALNTAISENTLDLNDASLTQDQLTTATANLNSANAAAALAVKKYNTYNTAITTINGGTNVDLTSLIDNNGFELGNTSGWTNSGSITANAQGNDAFDNKKGSYYCERWHVSGTVDINQTLSVLPAGIYEISAYLYTDTGDGKLYANETETSFSTSNNYSALVEVADKESIKFGAKCTLTGSTWICMDEFKLIYIGTIDDLDLDYTLETRKMSNAASTAQSDAESTFLANKTLANYNALKVAIEAAQASADAYSYLTPAISDADAFANSADVSDEDVDIFFDTYNDIKSAYTDGTIADADIMTNVANVYNALAILAKKQNVEGATDVDMTYAIINHSFEYGDMTGWTATASSDTGIRETANTNYAATGSDRFYLFNTWWQGVPITQTVSDLPNGQYTLTASVASDGATIYLIANGEHNEGTETGGSYPSKDVMQEATITFLVKDGNATIGAVGGKDGTAGEHKDYVEDGYWWYKADNFRLTFNRELTPEELAVAPTEITVSDITLFKGNTETISVSYVPEDASEGYVSFKSSDESIATVSEDGVVTGVSYGEATITVTSTLDPAVTATSKVTVTAPLYSEASNLDFSEGPVTPAGITIRTYAKDKTGNDVAQMQPVTGWTFGVANGDAKASGVVEYGSQIGMGAPNDFYAPTAGPDDSANENVLGMVGVWTGSVQYVQNVKFPAGAYTVTVPVYKVGGNEALTKNLIGVVLDDGTEHFATTTSYTANTWTTEEISFVVAEDTYGKLSIGLNAPNVGSANSQRLYIDRFEIESVPLATEEEIAALNALIEEMDGNTVGFDEGDYAPYNNVEAIKALADAKNLDTENPIVESVVLEATEALQNVVWTANTEEVNAVYDGTFAAAENNGAPLGWRMSNNTLGGSYHSRAFVGDERLAEFNETNSAFYIRFDGTNSSRGSMYYYGDKEDGYSMPLKANTTYYVKVDFSGWGSTGKPLRLNLTGPEGFTPVSQEYNTSVRADNADNDPQQFYITFTTGETDGKYVINFQTPGADTNTHAVVVSNIELYRATSAIMAINATAQYGTFVAPFDVTIPEGVTAYTVDAVASNGELTLTALDGTIPANTPVVVYSEATDGVNETFYGKDNAAEDVTEGLLTGVYEETVVEPGNYVLQLLNGKTAFYKVSADTDEVKVGANRAYLTKPAGTTDSGIKAFFFGEGDDTPTGINAIDALQNGNAEIYNAAGVKMPTLQKGLNIIRTADGKTQKVLIK